MFFGRFVELTLVLGDLSEKGVDKDFKILPVGEFVVFAINQATK